LFVDHNKRIQEFRSSGVRSQESGVRSQESGVRIKKEEERRKKEEGRKEGRRKEGRINIVFSNDQELS